MGGLNDLEFSDGIEIAAEEPKLTSAFCRIPITMFHFLEHVVLNRTDKLPLSTSADTDITTLSQGSG